MSINQLKEMFFAEACVCSIENGVLILPESYACEDAVWYYKIAQIGARRGLRFLPKHPGEKPPAVYEGETYTKANRLAMPEDFLAYTFQDAEQVQVQGIGVGFEVFPLWEPPGFSVV